MSKVHCKQGVFLAYKYILVRPPEGQFHYYINNSLNYARHDAPVNFHL